MTAKFRSLVVALVVVSVTSLQAVSAAPIYTDAKVMAASSARADLDAASRQATQDAILNALRLFARKHLDPGTWRTEQPTIELFLRTRGTAHLSFSRLEKRRTEPGNTIHVWLTVGLREEGLRAALLSSLARPNGAVVCVLPLDEATDAQAGAVETQVAEAMLASGCNVVSRAQMEEIRWQEHLSALSRGDYAAAGALGLGFLADVAVRVRLSAKRSQNNQGIISAVATADVEGVDTHTARILFVTHLGPEKGFGLDLTRALDESCSKLAGQVAEYVGGQMAAHRQVCVRSVRVVNEGTLTAEQWTKLAEDLRRAPLVREVQVGNGALLCTVEGGPLAVAVAVEKVAGHRVVSLSADTVRMAQ